MIALVERMARRSRATVLVREQFGLALNRAGRSDEAERVLLGADRGARAEQRDARHPRARLQGPLGAAAKAGETFGAARPAGQGDRRLPAAASRPTGATPTRAQRRHADGDPVTRAARRRRSPRSSVRGRTADRGGEAGLLGSRDAARARCARQGRRRAPPALGARSRTCASRGSPRPRRQPRSRPRGTGAPPRTGELGHGSGRRAPEASQPVDPLAVGRRLTVNR